MRKVKLIAAIASIVILLAVLAGCGSSAIPKPEVPEDVSTVEITGNCNIDVDGSTITVSGETSFITGTLMEISIVAQNGMKIDSTKITKSGDNGFEANFVMTNDKYGENVKSITAFITVGPKTPGKQQDKVYTEYGDKFELITNTEIWNSEGNIVTIASEPYEL